MSVGNEVIPVLLTFRTLYILLATSALILHCIIYYAHGYEMKTIYTLLHVSSKSWIAVPRISLAGVLDLFADKIMYQFVFKLCFGSKLTYVKYTCFSIKGSIRSFMPINLDCLL
ncbi:hypothetical protein ACJX0J_014629 [Zea mays]